LIHTIWHFESSAFKGLNLCFMKMFTDI